MKILIINDNGIEVGGAETYLKNLKAHLLKQGHDVRVLTSKSDSQMESFGDYFFTGVNQESPFRIVPYIFNLSAYFRLKNVLKEFRPDVVHLHFIFYHTSPSVMLLLKKIPVVMTTHAHELLAPVGLRYSENCNHPFIGYCMKCTGFLKYYPERFKRFFFNKVATIDLFIAPSNYYKSLYSQAGYKPITTLHNGIQMKSESPPLNSNKHNLLYVGRLAEEKGVEYIIRALPLILKKFPDTNVIVVGDGPDMERLNKMSEKLLVSSHTTFTGKVKNDHVEKYYQQSTIVVVPSTYPDNLPTVCIEAMNCGRPIIAARIGGIPELVEDGRNGYLFEPKNSTQLAEKVIALFSDKEKLTQFGKKSRQMIEKFSIDTHTSKLLSLYKQVTKND